ncbi:hypothetical protein A0257_21440 [Hymenobacter psoromatis]|nr:hypothetical protein A0257_21440 [Hymenobacter psoromatis]
MPESFDKKIMLVTGATSGIGLVTARELARGGAHVVLLARDPAKAERTRQKLVAATGNPRIDTVLADLSSQQQVRAVAAELHALYPRLDVLVNNAGLMFGAQRQVSVDGDELTLATNYLGPFLLTSLLLDLLRQSPAARVVNVSSTAAFLTAAPNLDDLQAERSYNALLAYGTTKLWNIMFTQELARRLRAHGITNVTTNVLHPGLIASNFGAEAQGPFKWFLQLWRPFMLSTEKGARTSIFLATDPSVATTSGGYFVKKRPEPVKSAFATAANAERLWKLSEQLTGTTFLD